MRLRVKFKRWALTYERSHLTGSSHQISTSVLKTKLKLINNTHKGTRYKLEIKETNN